MNLSESEETPTLTNNLQQSSEMGLGKGNTYVLSFRGVQNEGSNSNPNNTMP